MWEDPYDKQYHQGLLTEHTTDTRPLFLDEEVHDDVIFGRDVIHRKQQRKKRFVLLGKLQVNVA